MLIFVRKEKIELQLVEKENELEERKKAFNDLSTECEELRTKVTDFGLDMEILIAENESLKLDLEEKNSSSLVSQISQLSGGILFMY